MAAMWSWRGVAPSESARDQAIALAENTWGVNKVDWQGEVASDKELPPPADPVANSQEPTSVIELQTPEVAIVKAKDALLLSGSSSTNLTGAEQLPIDSSNYEINSLFAELPTLIPLIELAQDLPNGTALMVAGNRLTLTGSVDALGKKKQIELQIAEFYSGDIDNQLSVQLAAVAEDQLVSKDQCQEMFNTVVREETINFKTAKAEILPASFDLLDRLTQLSMRCPDAQFVVSGHTDNTGNSDFNTRISLQRAQAVIDHIVNSGVSSDRFQAEGKGQSEPIADNDSVEGRAKNRRVEFKIVD